MRKEVIELGKLGPLPETGRAVRENLQELVNQYEKLIMSIKNPVSNDEARILSKLFGTDDCFGLVWPLIGLIESAPDWPLQECLGDTSNEWIQVLKQRTNNATRL